MTSTVPTLIATTEIPTHPAVLAWGSLGGDPPDRVARLRFSHRSKPALYRLDFTSAARPAVFAKHGSTQRIGPERRVYEAILPHVPVTSPRYHGSIDASDGTAWMFIEDVGDSCFAPQDPVQSAVAARWLGRLHGTTAALAASVNLPPAGPERYRALLLLARAEILARLGNPMLSVEDLGVLHAVLRQLDRLEKLWPRLEQACVQCPVTLVHADFQPRNLRMQGTGDDLSLRPIDWETAGWGVPAADLALLRGRRLVMPVDPRIYGETVRERLPQLDDETIQRLSLLGHVFLSLSAIKSSCADLQFESADCLEEPISCMRLYVAHIDATLQACAGWLA